MFTVLKLSLKFSKYLKPSKNVLKWKAYVTNTFKSAYMRHISTMNIICRCSHIERTNTYVSRIGHLCSPFHTQRHSRSQQNFVKRTSSTSRAYKQHSVCIQLTVREYQSFILNVHHHEVDLAAFYFISCTYLDLQLSSPPGTWVLNVLVGSQKPSYRQKYSKSNV